MLFLPFPVLRLAAGRTGVEPEGPLYSSSLPLNAPKSSSEVSDSAPSSNSWFESDRLPRGEEEDEEGEAASWGAEDGPGSEGEAGPDGETGSMDWDRAERRVDRIGRDDILLRIRWAMTFCCCSEKDWWE